MTKTTTNKERIIRLSARFTPKETAEIVGTSVAYVYNVLSKHYNGLGRPGRPSLNLKNYIDAHRIGITDKKELAAYFGVSRWTINRFEGRPETRLYLERYLKFREEGVYLVDLRKELSGILEMLEMFEPKSRTTRTVRALIAQIDKYDKQDN